MSKVSPLTAGWVVQGEKGCNRKGGGTTRLLHGVSRYFTDDSKQRKVFVGKVYDFRAFIAGTLRGWGLGGVKQPAGIARED